MTAQGLEFYSTLAAEVASILCTGYAWELLAALPEPWEDSATAQQNVWEPPEGPRAVPVQFLSP